MEGAEKNILQVHNLSIGYISAPLFEKINFSVSQNQIAAVIGMNGTGKSTLLRTLCNLQSPLAGKVFIAGKDIVSFSAQELARIISIVLPGRAEAVQVLSVSEILFFARAPYTGYLHKLQKTDFEIVENIIEQLEISTLIKKKLYQLSDGETQKVFLAKALVQDTPVLFLDEPTSHLDIINRIEIFRMIGKLAKQQNKTILFASHELDLSLQIADVCLLFNKKGQVVFGKTEELIEQNRIEDFLLEGKYQFNKKLRSVEIKL